jgi:hypothetical protein
MSEKIYNMVDLETIEKLADIVSAKDLGEITIADGEKTITVKGKKCPYCGSGITEIADRIWLVNDFNLVK